MSAALESLVRNVPQRADSASSLLALMAFLVIGSSGAVSFVALSSLVNGLGTGVAPWLVNGLCYAALIGPVYLLQRRYSFRSDAAHRRALPRYLAVQASALMLATLFSFLVHGMLSLPTVVSSMLVIALTSGLNFLVLRGWAFARSPGLTLPAA